MNQSPALTILVACQDLILGQSIVQQLEERGHLVSQTDCAQECLALPRTDVLLLDLEFGPMGGFDLLADFQGRGNAPRVVLIGTQPLPEDFRTAMRMGAADLIPTPFTGAEIVRAVEATPVRPKRTPELRCTIDATAAGVDRGAREIAAWLLRLGVAPATRCRVSSAVAEAMDNAARHAYMGSVGPVEITAQVKGRNLFVSVRDRGIGTHSAWINPVYLEDTESGGFARIFALTEDMTLEPEIEGTHLVLTFSVYSTSFDDQRVHDLSELDYLSPAQSRNVLHSLADPNGPTVHLSPALAVSVGRLLAGPDPQRVLELSLRS